MSFKNEIVEKTGTKWEITSTDSGGVLKITINPDQKIVFESGNMICHDSLISLGILESTIYTTLINTAKRLAQGENAIEMSATNNISKSNRDTTVEKRKLDPPQTIELAPSADGAVTLFEIKGKDELHIQRGHYFARSVNCKLEFARIVLGTAIKRFSGFMDVIHVVAKVDTEDTYAEEGPNYERAVIALNSAGRLLKKKLNLVPSTYLTMRISSRGQVA